MTQNQWKLGHVDTPSLWAAGSSRVFSDCPQIASYLHWTKRDFGGQKGACHFPTRLTGSFRSGDRSAPCLGSVAGQPQACAQMRPQCPHQHGWLGNAWVTETELTSRKIKELLFAAHWDGRGPGPSPRWVLYHEAMDPGVHSADSTNAEQPTSKSMLHRTCQQEGTSH